jgi:hypothetical protein
MTLEFSRQTFEKYLNIKFRENASSGNPSFFRRTDATKLTIAFLNFANVPTSYFHKIFPVFWTVQFLKMRPKLCFGKSVITYPVSQCHIPEERRPLFSYGLLYFCPINVLFKISLGLFEGDNAVNICLCARVVYHYAGYPLSRK